MIQILSGLITYLLLDIYCHEQHGEPVSINRVRQLCNKILNESGEAEALALEKERHGDNSAQSNCASP